MHPADVAAVGPEREAEPRGTQPPIEAWVRALGGAGRDREEAVRKLHALMLGACRTEVARRASSVGLTGPDVDDLAQQAAGDATIAVLAKLTTFRRESRFTTWAYKFAVFEVSAAIGRHVRRSVGVRLDGEAWGLLPDRSGTDPAEQAQARELVRVLRRAVDEHLTPRQRTVFLAIVVDGLPLDVLVTELDTNRNALYKAVFDARRRIRDVLIDKGYAGQAGADPDRPGGACPVTGRPPR